MKWFKNNEKLENISSERKEYEIQLSTLQTNLRIWTSKVDSLQLDYDKVIRDLK